MTESHGNSAARSRGLREGDAATGDDEREHEYTLRVVFSGIVALVPEPGEDGEPKTFWALVPNLTDPSRLPSLPYGDGHQAGHGGHGGTAHDHRDMPPHRNRFVVPVGHLKDPGGREVRKADEVCEEPGTFEFVELANEHLTLKAKARETAVEIFRTRIQPPVPCDPGTDSYGRTCGISEPRSTQERNFQWTPDVDTLVAGLVEAGQVRPRIRQELFEPDYTPRDYPLISARFAFDRGTVATRKLAMEADDRYSVYYMPALRGKDPVFNQAVATQVELALTVTGAATFESRTLDGRSGSLQPIVIEGRGQSEVVLFVENQPDLPCNDASRFDPRHFDVNYCLLDRPDALKTIRRPEPEEPPALNAQCSPSAFSYPSGDLS